MKLYLHNMFLRVLEEIQYNSEEEKMAMFNIVSNWTDVRKIKNFKVYGKTTAKIEPGFQEVSFKYFYVFVTFKMCLMTLKIYSDFSISITYLCKLYSSYLFSIVTVLSLIRIYLS